MPNADAPKVPRCDIFPNAPGLATSLGIQRYDTRAEGLDDLRRTALEVLELWERGELQAKSKVAVGKPERAFDALREALWGYSDAPIGKGVHNRAES